MAERRCFTKKITESDAFLDMPLSTQCLYFHLNLNACDDDGFVSNPKRVMRLIGASEDDLKVLIMKSFVIAFDTGVIVIKHWRMHNTLRSDRYVHTSYVEELNSLSIKDNGSYTLATKWQPNGNQLETEDKISKDKLSKDNNTKRFTPPCVEEVQAYCNERKNGIDANTFCDFYQSKGWKVGNNPMKDWKAAVRTWEQRRGYSEQSMQVEDADIDEMRKRLKL